MSRGPIGLTLAAALLVSAMSGRAQPRASSCFFSADFEGEDALAGWDIGDAVEQLGPDGSGSGVTVAAWTVGDAAMANAAGYFPVPDQPTGNRAVMANDAAPPCNCDMSVVMLTSPQLDFSSRSGVALECRVFHEGTLGAGPAILEVDLGDGFWIPMMTIPTSAGQWRPLHLDMTAFDGQPLVRFRFRWSDGGNWSSGFAVDDICLRERTPNDLGIVRVLAHDAASDPFTTGDQGLRYTRMPLEQAGPITASVEVTNSGTDILRDIQVDVTISLDGTDHGPFNATILDSLLPGERLYLAVPTGWIPDEVGLVQITAQGSTSIMDDDPSDDTASTGLWITGPGWDGGYSAMACDDDVATAIIGGTGPFLAANRMEFINPGSEARGISAMFGAGTQPGAIVRAILMDANFSVIDTSVRRTLTAEDMDAIWNGLPIYLPLSSAPVLQTGDVFAGMQHLADDADHPAFVQVGGDAPVGRSILMEGIGFTLSYLYSTPMVRLHLAELGVSVMEPTEIEPRTLRAYPVPSAAEVRLEFTLPGTSEVTLELMDQTGRMVAAHSFGRLPPGHRSLSYNVQELPAGSYIAVLAGGGAVWHGRLHVVH